MFNGMRWIYDGISWQLMGYIISNMTNECHTLGFLKLGDTQVTMVVSIHINDIILNDMGDPTIVGNHPYVATPKQIEQI